MTRAMITVAVDDVTIEKDPTGKLRIKNGGVTSDKLAANAVIAGKIAADAVDAAAIATDAVGSPEIISGSVGDPEISSEIKSASLTTALETVKTTIASDAGDYTTSSTTYVALTDYGTIDFGTPPTAATKIYITLRTYGLKAYVRLLEDNVEKIVNKHGLSWGTIENFYETSGSHAIRTEFKLVDTAPGYCYDQKIRKFFRYGKIVIA